MTTNKKEKIIKALNEETGYKFKKFNELEINKSYKITNYSIYDGTKGTKINIYLDNEFIISLPVKYVKIIIIMKKFLMI